MKLWILSLYLLLIIPISSSVAQTLLPTFLEGTWKMENREVYEVWEITEDEQMKGHSYRIREAERVITEYLEINHRNNQVIYTATVLNQNEGRGIDFMLNRPDSLTWVFENPEHDFPKVISYTKRSDSEIYVQASDGGERGFAYLMHKIQGEDEHGSALRKFFETMNGTWIAAPADSAFLSRLDYTQSENGFIVIAENTITSKTGELFAKYEGVYVYNPVEKNVTFTTITKDEIHTGTCHLNDDILCHTAHVSGNSGIKYGGDRKGGWSPILL